MPQIRTDPITRQAVIVAADREERPNQFRRRPVEADGSICPFCAESMQTPPAVSKFGDLRHDGTDSAQRAADWQVCVVPNRYPIVTSDVTSVDGLSTAQVSNSSQHVSPQGSLAENSDNMLTGSREAAGRHEVVVESPIHVSSITQLTAEQVTWMLTAYRDRLRIFRDEFGLRYGLAIKNFGPDAGASLEHAHSQLFGLDFVPPRIELELAGAKRWFDERANCVFCELMDMELATQSRVVLQTNEFIAWCPYASRFAYELWIAPRQHASRYEFSDVGLLEKLGDLLKKIALCLERHPQIHAYNYMLHNPPFDTYPLDHYHWHIELIPRTAKAAGFEWGSGIHINTVAPEQAAEEYRQYAAE